MRGLSSMLLPAVLAASLAAGDARVRVTAEHAGLRLQNDDTVEVACPVAVGQELTLLGPIEGTWVPVAPPKGVSFWIYAELVRQGRVVANKAQVRSGAGLTYKVIGSLDRGLSVETVGRLGDWLKIKPPPTLPLWINRGAVIPVSSDSPPQIVSLSPALAGGLLTALGGSNATACATANGPDSPLSPGTGLPVRVADPLAVLPPELRAFRLTQEPLQGRRIRFVGTLRPVVPGATSTSAKFRLSGTDRSGGWVTFCHVIGPDASLVPQTGHRVKIEGMAWWLAGESLPVLQAEQISPQP
jgi:hypothetical protein